MKRAYSLLFVTLLFLTGCAGTPDVYRENPVAVATLALGEMQENPKQITATLTGYTGVCERLETRQRREGRTFYLSVVGIYEGPADAPCPAVAVEYTQTVMLDLEGLEPGIYTVSAGDKSGTFTLPSAERRTVEATIESVDVVLRESYPVRVVVYVDSYYGGCDTYKDISQRREENTFFVTVLVSVPISSGKPPCPPTEYPFTEQIILETAELAPGEYLVSVNGVEETFTLP